MSFLDFVGKALAALCPLAVTVFAVTLVWALSGTDDLPLFVSDDDEPLVVDPPATRPYVDPQWTDIAEHVQGIPIGDGVTEVSLTMTRDAPPGWVMFLGGLVHVDCVGPYLRDGTRPCAGCADHFERVLTGAQ